MTAVDRWTALRVEWERANPAAWHEPTEAEIATQREAKKAKRGTK